MRARIALRAHHAAALRICGRSSGGGSSSSSYILHRQMSGAAATTAATRTAIPIVPAAAQVTSRQQQQQPIRGFFSPGPHAAQVHSTLSDAVEFSDAGGARRSPEECGMPGAGPPPDERTLKLGKTLRILQSRLPSILASPLPVDILSPHISLHLFPSTHPHLPTVSGRVAYHAALWTSPITWGSVPLIGNVRLKIVSERMVKNGPSYHDFSSSSYHSPSSPPPPSSGPAGGPASARSRPRQPIGEKLIVRWKTCSKENSTSGGSGGSGGTAVAGSQANNGRQVLGKMAEWLGRDANGGAAASSSNNNNNNGNNGNNGFEGLFIFEFDDNGRILSHTIERAEHCNNWDEGVGKWVGLTDWLLGRLGGSSEPQPQPGLALGCVRDGGARRGGRRFR